MFLSEMIEPEKGKLSLALLLLLLLMPGAGRVAAATAIFTQTEARQVRGSNNRTSQERQMAWAGHKDDCQVGRDCV